MAKRRSKKRANRAVLAANSPRTNPVISKGLSQTVKNIMERQRLARQRAVKVAVQGAGDLAPQRQKIIFKTGVHVSTHSPKARALKNKEKAPLLTDRPTCKDRPDARKARRGQGVSRPFIPWCDRKR